MPHRRNAVDMAVRESARRVREPRRCRSTQVENKREDLARDAARLERLEKKMEDHEKLRDSEDAEVTEEQRAEARNYVATNSGVLDDKRADFHRRKESLEKLEKQLADYQALLDEEDREAKERLESARLAKAEFEEREGAEEDARAAELQTKKKQLVKELGEVDLQIVQHEDEGLETDELESKKSELEEAIAKVDTELRQMRERADRRAKLAEFNKGELEREKAAKAKKALQEKLRADKKAEIMDRMRRKQQEEEEKREKDEIEAQKQREVRCSVCSIRGRGAVLGDRSRSSPSEKAVGGLFFIFEPFRGVSRCLTHVPTRRSRPKNKLPVVWRRWAWSIRPCARRSTVPKPSPRRRSASTIPWSTAWPTKKWNSRRRRT